MTVPAETPDARLDLLDPLIYADTFDCAATLEELWHYSRARSGREALRVGLRDDPVIRTLVAERDGLYCLCDRPGLLDRRAEQMARARVLQKRGRRVARAIRHVPFVRGIALTGSAAADDAPPGADVDLLVIAAPRRLGTVFALLGPASRLLGRRLFCPNYYVAEDHLALAPGGVYLARELAQARPLVGNARGLREANPWLYEVFPNLAAPAPLEEERAGPTRFQRLLESALEGVGGDRLEARARRLAESRLRAHYGGLGQDVPAEVSASFAAGVALRFHGGGMDTTTLGRYEARRAEIAERIAGLAREATPAVGR